MREGRTASVIILPMRTLAASLNASAGSLLLSASLRLSKLSSASPFAEKFRSGLFGARAMEAAFRPPVEDSNSLCNVRFRTSLGASPEF